MVVAQITNPSDGKLWEYYIEPRFKRFLDAKVKDDLSKKDKDYVMIIDGYEGSGKSTFASQIGRYVDPTLSLDNICMTAEQFRQAVLTAKKNQCVIYDEAVTGMSASESLTRVGRMLKSLMMQMRQKNLFIIVVMPWIFEFNKYAVLGRARWFFHVYEQGGKRGYVVGYNKKDMRMVYLLGKKTFSYKIWSTFTGKFFSKYAIEEEPYRKKKEEYLQASTEDEEEGNHRWKKQRDACLKLLSSLGLTYDNISERLASLGVRISRAAIGKAVGKEAENAE